MSRFRDVDADRLSDDLVSYLDVLGRLPVIEAMRQCSLELVAREAPGEVLEIGSGTGETTSRLASLCRAGAVGVDLSDTLTRIAKSRHPSVAFLQGEATALNLPSSSFDVCYVERVIMHVSDLLACVSEIGRVLRPGGLFISVEPSWAAATLKCRARQEADEFQDAYVREIVNPMAPDAIRAACLARDWTPVFLNPTELIADTFEGADLIIRFSNALERRGIGPGPKSRLLNTIRTNFGSFKLPFVVQAWRT
jgi:ubiquinone/menaquinone biosynthesis C-methylase UbiE